MSQLPIAPLRRAVFGCLLSIVWLIFATVARGQTLRFDPLKHGTGSDDPSQTYLWDTTAGNTIWSNGSTDGLWVNGDIASIGSGTANITTSPVISIDQAGGITVGGITFNALGAGSTVGYTINDGSGTGANPIVVNSGSVITDNAVGVTTINANLTNAAAFNLGVAGSGNLTLGGNVGLIGGGAAALTVANTFSGTLTLGGLNNNISATTINGGRIIAAAGGSLGGGGISFAASGATLRVGTNGQSAVSGFGGGFGAGANQWTQNNNGIFTPVINGNSLQLTSAAGNESTSAYFNTPVSVAGGFTASYTFTGGTADGVAFVLQNQGLTALGGAGGGIGYGGVAPSAAFEIEAFQNQGVAWASNGAVGTYTSVAGPGLVLDTGHPINVRLSYNPANTTLTATLMDQTTSDVYTFTSNAVNLAGLFPAGTALVGFSGGTGGSNGVNSFSSFSYTNTYSNNITLSAATSSTIDVAATAVSPIITMGALTSASGSQLNVTGATVTTPGQPYGLTLGNAVLSGTTTFNVANAAGGGGGTVRLGTVSNGTSPGGIVMSGAGTLQLSNPNTFTGGMQINFGTVAISNNSPLGSGAVTLAGGRLQVQSPAAGSNPVATTGFTKDEVWGIGEASPANGVGTTGGVDNGTNVLFQAGVSATAPAGAGLPSSGQFTSAANANVNFQLANYIGNNALRLNSATTTGTLQLVNPTQFQNIAILETGGSGATNFNVTLNFADGGSATTFNGTTPDWFNGANPALGGLSRVQQNGTFQNATTNPRMYETDLTLSAADQSRVLTSIGFTWTGTGASVLDVFAISGTATGPTFNNALNVAANSTLDVTGPASAAFSGTASIGNAASTASIKLSVTGGSTGTNAPYSVYLGTYPGAPGSGGSGVQLTGGASGSSAYLLDVANNGAGAGTLYLGPLNDNAHAATITLQNSGAVVLKYAGTLLAGSTFNVGPLAGINGGTLRVGNSSGSATGSATVNINAGGMLGVAAAAGATQGTISGPVTDKNGGTLLGASGAPLFASGGLILQGGSLSSFTFSGTPNGTANALIATSGGAGASSLSITGAHTIGINAGSSFPLLGGTYDLFSYTGTALTTTAPSGTTLTFINGGSGTMTLGGSLPQTTLFSYSLSNNSAGKQIDLIVTPLRLTWTGLQNGSGSPLSTWDTMTGSKNWANTAIAATNYADGNPVRFQDTNPINSTLVPNSAGVATVNIQPSGVQPGVLEFDNAGSSHGGVDYVLTGGPIGGSVGLAMLGNGSFGGGVSLTASNSFSGPVSIAFGSLVLQNSTALGNSSAVSVSGSGGALVLQSIAGASVMYGATQNGSGTIPLTLNGAGNSPYSGALASTSGVNTYAGPISVGTSGAATIASLSATGDALTLSGGINLASGTLSFAGAGSTTVYSNPIVDSGAGSPGSVVVSGPGGVTFAVANAYHGSTSINSGNLSLIDPAGLGNSTGVAVSAGASLVLAGASGSAGVFGNAQSGAGTIGLTLNGSGLAAGPTGALVSIAGINTFTGLVAVGASNAASAYSGSTVNGDQLTMTGGISIPSGRSLTFSGPGNFSVAPSATGGGAINGAGTLAMIGTGYLTISSAGALTGTAAINSGTTVLTNTAALGTGTISMNGGTLRLGVPPPTSISGFGGTSIDNNGGGTPWQVNNTAIASNPINADVLTLTDGANGEARSAYYQTAVPVVVAGRGFSTSFVYQDATVGGADGVTFVLHNDSRGTIALGAGGGSLGYAGITPSVALEINIYNGHPIGTQLLTNGVIADAHATAPIDFSSGDPINVALAYNPATTTLTETDTDLTTSAVFTTSYTVDIAAVLGGNSAIMGFTGATGGVVSTQTISNFGYTLNAGTTYSNNVVLASGSNSTMDVAATAAAANVTLGNVTASAGAAPTLNITAATAPPNLPYGLTFGAVTLHSNLTLNVANNGSGIGTVTLGPVSDAGGGFGLSIGGQGTIVLSSANSYTGNTAVTAGTLRLADGSTNNIAGSPLITLSSGATLDATGLASGTIVLGAGSSAQILRGSGPTAFNGAVTVNTNSALGGTSGGTLTVSGGVSLLNQSHSTFMLGAPNGAGNAPTSLINITGGGLSVTGTNIVDLTGSPQAGTYELYAFTSGTPSISQFQLGANPVPSLMYEFSVVSNAEVDLIVTASPSSAQWNFNGSGNYSEAAKWNPTQPPNNAAGSIATFGNGVSTNVTSQFVNVTIDGADTLGSLTFSNTNGAAYILGSDGVNGHGIVLNNNGQGATVAVASGATAQQQIYANMTLADNATFNIASGGSLLVTVGSISETGGSRSLTKTGGGTLVLDTPNSYSGGTIVTNGTLTVTPTGSAGSGSLEVDTTGGNISVVNLQNNQTVTALSGTVSGGGSARVNVAAGSTLTVNKVAGSATFAGTVALTAGAAPGTGGALAKSGNGGEILTAAPNLGNNSVLSVRGGTLNLNVVSGSAAVGSGVTASITNGATLELAGVVSTLGTSAPTHRANIANLSTAASGLLVSGGQQQVGGIDGPGNVQVNSNASLIANHMTAGALVIGGSPGNPALVTIDASDPSGAPLGDQSSMAVAGALIPSSSFAAGVSSASSSLCAGELMSGGDSPNGRAAADAATSDVSASVVPEPSSLWLSLLAALAATVFTYSPALRSVLSYRRRPTA